MNDTRERVLESYHRLGSKRAVAIELGLARSTVWYHIEKAGADAKPLVAGRVGSMVTEERRALPAKGKVKRYILTCAQNNTKIYDPVFGNLLAFAKHYKAELLVSRFTYNKSAFGRTSVKSSKTHNFDFDQMEDIWYAPELAPYICDNRVELAPTLVFCGEMNTLPTAKRPLQGFETYTGSKSGIFPHTKMAMQSVATAKHDPAKMNYTTGTVTQRNYIQRRAGLTAEFHHSYSALLVEVDSDGEWWVRQLNHCEADGTMYDVDVCSTKGKITTGNPVEAITWGDIHQRKLEDDMLDINWSKPGSIMSVLKPLYQFVHDLMHFESRNHHERGNPHSLFRRHVRDDESVKDEVMDACDFLETIDVEGCETVVIHSNHDDFLMRWLREDSYKNDPVNALFFLEMQLEVYKAIERGDKEFMILEHALKSLGCPGDTRFLQEDESYIICEGANGGIECGMHGHLGPDGARGNAGNLARMGRKANVGHSHKAGIWDGMYIAGVTGALDQGYNRGPSTWSHSHIVTYKNGKRAIITVSDGKWRAKK